MQEYLYLTKFTKKGKLKLTGLENSRKDLLITDPAFPDPLHRILFRISFATRDMDMAINNLSHSIIEN